MTPTDATLAARDKLQVAGGGGGARGARYFTDWLVDQSRPVSSAISIAT